MKFAEGMKKYANLGGNSGIKRYKNEKGAIIVEFKPGGKDYVYPKDELGKNKSRRLNELLDDGIGANRYINRSLRKR